MTSKELKIKSLREALANCHPQDPMRAAYRAGLDFLLDPEFREPPPPDVPRDKVFNQPVTITIKGTTGKARLH